jgi:hypothetical protein
MPGSFTFLGYAARVKALCIAALLLLTAAPVAAAPNLALSLSMDMAGGGPGGFTTNRLINVLFGDRHVAELGRLQRRFGFAHVASFIHVSDFVVPNAMAIVQSKGMTLPDDPSPSPRDTTALAGALYRAGLDASGSFRAQTMLDALLSAPVRVAVVRDVEAKFGRAARENYFTVLTRVMDDLGARQAGAERTR